MPAARTIPLTNKQKAMFDADSGMYNILIGKAIKDLRRKIGHTTDIAEEMTVDITTDLIIGSLAHFDSNRGTALRTFLTSASRTQYAKVCAKLRVRNEEDEKLEASACRDLDHGMRKGRTGLKHGGAKFSSKWKVRGSDPAPLGYKLLLLSQEEKEVICTRYGINGKYQHALAEAKEALLLGTVQIRALESSALQKLGALRGLPEERKNYARLLPNSRKSRLGPEEHARPVCNRKLLPTSLEHWNQRAELPKEDIGVNRARLWTSLTSKYRISDLTSKPASDFLNLA